MSLLRPIRGRQSGDVERREVASKQPRSQLESRAAPLLFLVPQITVTSVFLLLPILGAVILSLFRASPTSVSWRGLDNYQILLQDDVFRGAVTNTVLFVLVVVPMSLAVGLAIALVLFRLRPAYQSLYRIVFYLPVLLGVVVISMVWRYLYDPVVGMLNYILSLVGISAVAWIGDPTFALPSLMLVVFTFTLGEAVIILLAGLVSIPLELTEAAKVDGAGGWRLLVNITLPLMRPAILFTVIVQTISVFQVWIVPFILTGGGPANSTQTIGLQIYQTAFARLEFGLAAAQGVVLVGIVGIVAATQARYLLRAGG